MHPKGAGLSNVEIAVYVGVDEKTVRKYRDELKSTSDIPKIDSRTVKRGDQEYQINTSNIGRGRFTTSKRRSGRKYARASNLGQVRKIYRSCRKAMPAMPSVRRERFTTSRRRNGRGNGQINIPANLPESLAMPAMPPIRCGRFTTSRRRNGRSCLRVRERKVR